ncbi:MAG: flagellar biosynthesis protein FlhA [Epsilonproteobacteria bacterium]|nr:MAG: flagellar biosynthesis protein FlhA [Campylobacterota bacterium]RLA66695.1 MAG: flagellar biosynthesis protein FlhA [Campylobacterota bacterium]
MDDFFSHLKGFKLNSDLAIGLGSLCILVLMIVPVPPWMLDLFLSFTLTMAIIILLMSIYARKPLEFSTFPSVLLGATLLRLSLNVASTRNILLRGGNEGTNAAGQVIKSFGEFVVEGNYVVGLIIFIILVIINFVVITKGAGRVAEVAARFTLDAMPGKQMAIDADLNAGLINEEEAKERRKEVAQEADFYGAMDGASKFVRGDAIAGILITLINIIGGIIVGMVQNEMSFQDATQTFTLLTIGDGLVTQIPALVISTAAGMLITRNTKEGSLGEQVAKQFQLHPKSIFIASFVLYVFAMIPGLPTTPFVFIATIFILLGLSMQKWNRAEKQEAENKKIEEKESKAENLEELLNLELVELEVGYGLVNFVDAEQNGDLLERISHIRKQFVLDWGVIVPPIRIRDNLELKPSEYSVKIKGIEVAKGDLMSDHMLAMDPGDIVDKVEGIDTVEPVFGLNAVWISEEQKENAQYNGYTVVDLPTIIATHLTEILKSNLHEIFGRQELVRIMDNFKETYPKIVTDLIPDILPLGIILKVLQNLLREGVSIRDMRSILENLSEHGTNEKDPELLTEMVRQALYRTITEEIKSPEGDVPLYTLDRNIEEQIAGNLIQTEKGTELSLDPKITQGLLSKINEKIEEATDLGERMIILCSPSIRGHFKKLMEKFIPNLIVVSHNEINPNINIRSLGTVRL